MNTHPPIRRSAVWRCFLPALAGGLALRGAAPSFAQSPPAPPPVTAAPAPAKNPALVADLAPFKALAEQVKAAFDKGQTDVAKAACRR